MSSYINNEIDRDELLDGISSETIKGKDNNVLKIPKIIRYVKQ